MGNDSAPIPASDPYAYPTSLSVCVCVCVCVVTWNIHNINMTVLIIGGTVIKK